MTGDLGDAVGQVQGRFQRLGQAQLQVFAYLEAIDHDVDVMFLAQLQLRRIVEFAQFAVHPGADKALFLQAFEELHVFTLAIADHGREQHQAFIAGCGQDLIDHLTDRTGLER